MQPSAKIQQFAGSSQMQWSETSNQVSTQCSLKKIMEESLIDKLNETFLNIINKGSRRKLNNAINVKE